MILKGDYIENLKNKIQMEQLTHITLLSPETAKHLQVQIIMMIKMIMIMIIVIKSLFCLDRTWLSRRSLT